MSHAPTILERVSRFFTGTTPGRAKKNEAACKRDSDKIDAAQKQRANASVLFRQSKERFEKATDRNAVLSESAFKREVKTDG